MTGSFFIGGIDAKQQKGTDRAYPSPKESTLVSVFFFQTGLVRHEFCPGKAEQRANDSRCDDVGDCRNGSLQEHLVGGLAVDQDVENRRDDDPCHGMGDDLRDVEIDRALLAELAEGSKVLPDLLRSDAQAFAQLI